MLITGEPSTGKSLLALSMVKQGHQLISDDLVKLSIENNVVIASAPKRIKHLLQLRTVGLIDITQLIGLHAVTEKASLKCIISLSDTTPPKQQSINPTFITTSILGYDIPTFIYHPRQPHLPLLLESLAYQLMENRDDQKTINPYQ